MLPLTDQMQRLAARAVALVWTELPSGVRFGGLPNTAGKHRKQGIAAGLEGLGGKIYPDGISPGGSQSWEGR